MATTTSTTPSTTEAGRRMRDMLQVLEKRAPRLRPNLVPKSCKQFLDLQAICSTDTQRQAVRRVLDQQQQQEQQQKEGADGEDQQRLVVVADVNVDAGTCNVCAVKSVSEIEADLYSVEKILNLHSRGDNEELRLRLEHFLSINGYGDDSGEAAIVDAQEIYSLAYAIIVCLSAAPFKATVGDERLSLPLDANVDAGAVVQKLLQKSKPSAGASSSSSSKSKSSNNSSSSSKGNNKKRQRPTEAQKEEKGGEEKPKTTKKQNKKQNKQQQPKKTK